MKRNSAREALRRKAINDAQIKKVVQEEGGDDGGEEGESGGGGGTGDKRLFSRKGGWHKDKYLF